MPKVMVISKKYIVDGLYKYLTKNQKEMYDIYYKYNRDLNLCVKELLGKKYDDSTEDGKRQIVVWKQYYRKYPLLKLALEVTDSEIDVEKIDSPTLEWTLSELMNLYKHAEREFYRYEKDFVDNHKEGAIEKRDQYKKEMKELLKQITDFQNKFGEMLSDDSLKISMLSDDKFIEDLGAYTKEANEYLAKEKWYKKAEVA